MKVEKLFRTAEIARNRSRFSDAERIYHTILKAPRLSRLDQAEALLGSADVGRLQGKFTSSIADYRRALVLYDRVASPRSMDARTGLALALRGVGRPHEALVLLKKALEHYQADGDLDGIAFAHWALGGTWRIAGDLRRGWRELKVALDAYRKLGDREGEAYTCCALGGLARMRCDLAASSLLYRRANDLMRKRGDLFGTAYSYCGIGNAHRMRGNFRTALVHFNRAEKLYARIGDIVSYAYTVWSMGTAHKMEGRLERAAESFASAQKLFLKTGDTRGQAYALLGFAEILTLAGQPRKAHGLVLRAAALCRRGRFRWEALHVRALEDPKAARPLYRRAGSRFAPSSLPLNLP
jgi:tetratricopeptide (TPR) repeat protein